MSQIAIFRPKSRDLAIRRIPGAVAARALALGKPVHIFAGSATASQPPEKLKLHSITPTGVPLDQALRQASLYLGRAVRAAFA